MEQADTRPSLIQLLATVPFFRATDRLQLARLAGGIETIQLAAGSTVITEGSPADALYLLESGEVEVLISTPAGERRVATQAGPSYFGEMGLLLNRRTSTVRALTDVQLWKLPRARFDELVRDHPGFGLAVAKVGIERLEDGQRAGIGAPLKSREALSAAVPLALMDGRRSVRMRLVGATLVVTLPALLWMVPPPAGLTPLGWHVGLIMLAAAIGWFFEILPDFAVGLLMAAGWGVAGLLPLTVVFSGFASSAWVVAMASFAIALSLARSGLLFRTALIMLRIFPATHAGQLVAMVIGGILITPVVPLALARVAALAPLARELSQVLGYPPRSRASASLGLASLFGNGLFSSVFLSGLVTNFFLVSLLSPAEQRRFDWVGWLLAAAPFGILVLILGTAVLLIVFRPEIATTSSREVLHHQQKILGPPSRFEKAALAGTALFLVGVLLQPVLHLDSAWAAIGGMGVLVGSGMLDRERFRAGIDWGFLTLFGILLGMGSVLHQAGIDRWLSSLVVHATSGLHSPGAVLMVIALTVVIARLVLPWVPAMLLLSSALVPAATDLGLSPWLVGFVVLITSTTWLLPNQTDLYRLAGEATHRELLSDRYGYQFGFAFTLITLLGVALSIPYWRWLGLIGQ